ncbi:MAG: methylated-DNA/protein-cysteine methyltransferase [Rhodoferax sp.]|nr:methylated-DNA/protein-cysteine methyltransferase [Rhodoferax sp.]
MNDNVSGTALFDTAIGTCGIAWRAGSVTAVQLPEATAEGTRVRMLKALPPGLPGGEPALCQAGAVPPFVQAAIDGVRALLQGAPRDLREVPLDMTRVSDFHQRVYAIARRIAPGQTRSYGEVAAELGDKGLARAVGQALGQNPFAPIVPCHRVVAANGKPGGFSGGGGALTKLRMLAIEGAAPGGTRSLF